MLVNQPALSSKPCAERVLNFIELLEPNVHCDLLNVSIKKLELPLKVDTVPNRKEKNSSYIFRHFQVNLPN